VRDWSGWREKGWWRKNIAVQGTEIRDTDKEKRKVARIKGSAREKKKKKEKGEGES